MIPLPIIYTVGGIILVAIVWGFLRDISKADPEDRKKLIMIYTCVVGGGLILASGLSYFKVSERLFPSFYEREEIRQQLNDANRWEQNFKLEEWEVPFNEQP